MKKDAFTLAEVLITLGIIGIVAAMTMPALVANYQKKVTAAKLKKVSSTLSQGCKMALADDGVSEIAETSLYSSLSHHVHFAEAKSLLSKYYKIPGNVNYIKLASSDLPDPDGAIENGYEFNLSDGSKVYLYESFSSGKNLDFYVNINPGRKKVYKNVDLFAIRLSENCGIGLNGQSSSTQYYCMYGHQYFWHNSLCFANIVHDGWEIKYDFNSVKRAQDGATGGDTVHH